MPADPLPSLPPPTEPRPTVQCPPQPHPDVLVAAARERLWREWREAAELLDAEAAEP